MEKPHIVVILADDLGWNEVSWHNPGFLTPRMEALSSAGVRLDQSYVTPKCSPSRAALLSGRYPWRLGMQRGAIERWQDTGLDTGVDLLPELLGQGGYSTHLVRRENGRKYEIEKRRWMVQEVMKRSIFWVVVVVFLSPVLLRWASGTLATVGRDSCPPTGASTPSLASTTTSLTTTLGKKLDGEIFYLFAGS